MAFPCFPDFSCLIRGGAMVAVVDSETMEVKRWLNKDGKETWQRCVKLKSWAFRVFSDVPLQHRSTSVRQSIWLCLKQLNMPTANSTWGRQRLRIRSYYSEIHKGSWMRFAKPSEASKRFCWNYIETFGQKWKRTISGTRYELWSTSLQAYGGRGLGLALGGGKGVFSRSGASKMGFKI